MPLPGRHQAANAAVAVRAAELLAPELPAMTEEAVASGLSGVRWPGRLERLTAGDREVFLDGCHNPEGAAALAAFLEESGLGARAWLLFGAMADKDIERMASILFPQVAWVSLVPVAGARAATPEELARRVASVRPDARAEASLETALRRALSSSEPAPIIVAGSLYLVGEARAWLLAAGEADTNR
jgi:dihydrofolate synthase/folylpolyglutamate synthase